MISIGCGARVGNKVAKRSGLQIAPNLFIHSGPFLMRFEKFPNDFNADVGLLISGSKVRALVRPPSKYLKSFCKLHHPRNSVEKTASNADLQRTP
jgi:hypothetical protein